MAERAGPAYITDAHETDDSPGWQRDALTDRDRNVAVIAALVASHAVDDRLNLYVRLARAQGRTTRA